jgi:hypothetical protein
MALDWGFQSGKAAGELHTATLRKMATEDKAGQLDIRKAQTELEQNEAFVQAMKDGKVGGVGGTAGSPADASATLENLGMLALGTGNIDKGEKLLTASSTVANQQSLAARREAKTAHENLSTLANLYGGVTDETSWNRANAQYQMSTGQASPFAGQPYSEALVQQARSATITAKDRAAIAVSGMRQKLLDEQVKTEANRRALIIAQEKNTEARTTAIGKAGGTPVPTQYVTAVTNKLKDIFEDTGERNLSAAALPLAEQVFSRVRDEGLSMSEAVNAVVEQAQTTGELGGLTPMGEFSPGTHRDMPRAFPLDKKGAIDVTKLKKNQYYDAGNGAVIWYNPQGKLIRFEADEEHTLDDADVDEEDLDEEEE